MMNKLFKIIIEYAITNHCSDIHLELSNNCVLLYFRLNGQIIPYQQKNLPADLINYIAFKANLDVLKLENLATGMIQYPFLKQIINLRISLISNNKHKSMVIRIVNNHQLITIDQLCYYNFQTQLLKKIINYENGLVILSGKTGSGKTTTLYALIQQLLKLNKRIVSVENPVERNIYGITQIDIAKKNVEINLVFEQILRHDPDVIVFGEIRNNTELEYVINAALSGHLVLVTIHALSSEYVINKLKALKINELDLKAVIRLIIYQKLFYTKQANPKIVFEYLTNSDLNKLLNKQKFEHLTIAQISAAAIKKGQLYEGK